MEHAYPCFLIPISDIFEFLKIVILKTTFSNPHFFFFILYYISVSKILLVFFVNYSVGNILENFD